MGGGSGTIPSEAVGSHPVQRDAPLTFFLGSVLLHPVRYLPQAVKKEVSFLQADDLREEGKGGHGSFQGVSSKEPWGSWIQKLCVWARRAGGSLGLTSRVWDSKTSPLHANSSSCALRGLASTGFWVG